MLNYRDRILQNYAAHMQFNNNNFDSKEAVRWGGAYDTFFRGWLPLKKDADIVDVACGGGNLLHFFKSKGYTNLQGVDISPDQIHLAKQVVSNVVLGDALNFLQLNKDRYDLISAVDILEHFQKDEVIHFLEACYGSLKSGGRLIIQTPNAESPWGFTHRYSDFTHELSFTRDSLRRLLLMCGFKNIIARETGPVIHGFYSLVRFFLWQIIKALLMLWNLAETGGKGSGIFTRVFLMSAVK